MPRRSFLGKRSKGKRHGGGLVSVMESSADGPAKSAKRKIKEGKIKEGKIKESRSPRAWRVRA
jgi:hypothetical protein